jgi:hypothetical protein
MISITCPNCAVVFGITQAQRNILYENRNTFYCPAGHSMSFTGYNQADEIRTLKEHKEQLLAQVGNLKDQVEKLTRRVNGYKGHVEKNRRLRAVV